MKVYLLSRAEGLLLHSRSEAAMQIIINTLHFSSTLYLRSALQARTALSLTVSGRHKKKQEQPLYPRQKQRSLLGGKHRPLIVPTAFLAPLRKCSSTANLTFVWLAAFQKQQLNIDSENSLVWFITPNRFHKGSCLMPQLLVSQLSLEDLMLV